MPQHRGEQMVGVARIHGQRRNLLAGAEAQMRPSLACVGGFVDAVAYRQIGALQALAAGHVDDVGIGRRHRDGANGPGGLAIEDRRPGSSVVVGLPNAPVDLAHVEQIGLARYARGRAGPATPEGADVAPVQIMEEIGVDWLRAGCAG